MYLKKSGGPEQTGIHVQSHYSPSNFYLPLSFVTQCMYGCTCIQNGLLTAIQKKCRPRLESKYGSALEELYARINSNLGNRCGLLCCCMNVHAHMYMYAYPHYEIM